jgi:hypothetical protein
VIAQLTNPELICGLRASSGLTGTPRLNDLFDLS